MSQISIFNGVDGGSYSTTCKSNMGIELTQSSISENFFYLDPDTAVELLKAGNLSEEAVSAYILHGTDDMFGLNEGLTITQVPKFSEVTDDDYDRLSKDLPYWHR